MTQVVSRKVLGIQVSGRKNFDGHFWHNAILHYLECIWKGDDAVLYRPKINFFGTTLRLNKEKGVYYVYDGNIVEPMATVVSEAKETERIFVQNSKSDVEVGLISFIKNKRIKELVIQFPKDIELRLSKTKTNSIAVSLKGVLPTLQTAEIFYEL